MYRFSPVSIRFFFGYWKMPNIVLNHFLRKCWTKLLVSDIIFGRLWNNIQNWPVYGSLCSDTYGLCAFSLSTIAAKLLRASRLIISHIGFCFFVVVDVVSVFHSFAVHFKRVVFSSMFHLLIVFPFYALCKIEFHRIALCVTAHLQRTQCNFRASVCVCVFV